MSTPPPTLITCIYCKEKRPPSREHVLATSLGGDKTEPITCQECNTKALGRLDDALVQRSLVGLGRVAMTPTSAFNVKLVGDQFVHDTATDMYLEVYLTNEMRAQIHPQIHFRAARGQLAPHAPDKAGMDALVSFIDKRIAAGSLRSLHIKEGPSDRCTTTRLVMHREKDAFVRVAARGDEVAFFAVLEASWARLKQELEAGASAGQIEKPDVETHVAWRLDDEFRAVAKTAFNVVAMRLGVEFALRPEFDELREYVLGRDIRHSEQLKEDEIAVDTRFVTRVPHGEPPLVPTDGHAVTICYAERLLLAYVTLYKDFSYVVSLGTLDDLSEREIVSHEFSSVRKGNHALDIATLYDRLRKRGHPST